MKKWKNFEKLVRLIQEALKNIPDTQIFSNYKIENTSNNKREIDILIKSRINNFELLIAIECKDYKTRIPVEKIEAFNSKCQRINGISKKVFVASNGYQLDAIDAAKDFNIELYSLDEINNDEIESWFPIRQLNAEYLLKPPHGLVFNAELSKVNKLPSDKEVTIYFREDMKPIPITGFLWNNVIVEQQKKLRALLLYEFMVNKSNLNYQTLIPFELDVTGIYTLGVDGEKLDIVKIKSCIVGWLVESPVNVTDVRSYKNADNKAQANTVSIDVEKGESADIVLTENNDIKIFYTNTNGQVTQLKTLFEYDPKTDGLKDKRNEA